MALIAFVYTTPWDNYLVYRGVWGYGPERVLGVIGYVPLEEYLFFLLQPLLTGLWYLHLRARILPAQGGPPARLRWAAVAWWLLVTGAGTVLLLHPDEHLLYLGLILAWCGPVLAGINAIGFDHTWTDRRAALLGIAAPTLYLWVADRIAIGAGIWVIADRYSIPFEPFGLPIEEAVFFLVTNVMVVQGLTLLLPKRQSAIHDRAPVSG